MNRHDRLITAIFNSQHNAHEATSQISKMGIPTHSVSIVTRQGAENAEGLSNDNISDGAISGGVLGGLGGLLIGIGSVAVPGLGMLAAAGPIAGLIGGAVTGGIVGTLVDLGIPEEDASEYEDDLHSGKVLWSMEYDDNYADSVKEILRKCGAQKV